MGDPIDLIRERFNRQHKEALARLATDPAFALQYAFHYAFLNTLSSAAYDYVESMHLFTGRSKAEIRADVWDTIKEWAANWPQLIESIEAGQSQTDKPV